MERGTLAGWIVDPGGGEGYLGRVDRWIRGLERGTLAGWIGGSAD